jgi:hypothetical protein
MIIVDLDIHPRLLFSLLHVYSLVVLVPTPDGVNNRLNDQPLPVPKPKSVPDHLKSGTNPDASVDLTGSDVEDDQVADASAISKTKHGKAPVLPTSVSVHPTDSNPGELINRINTCSRFTPSYSFRYLHPSQMMR